MNDGGTNEERLARGGLPVKICANPVRQHRWLFALFSCLMFAARTSGSPAIDSPRPGARSSYYGNGVWLDGEGDSNEKGHGATNDANCLAHGVVLDLDPDWMPPASLDAKRSHHRGEHATPKQHITLPELEPMRLERPAGYYLTSTLHSTVTVRLSLAHGSSALLPCPVRQLSNRTVSWMKHSPDNVQLLTVGNATYANDNRLAVAWRYPGNWTLHISAVDLGDTGCYQCQVNTHPPIGLFVYLHVQGPAVTIVDDRNISVQEAVFKSGALIRLVCLVRQAEKDNFSLLWKSGPSVLNHDTQRGGVSVKTERRGRDAISWLLMARATSRDSGVYSCSVDGHSQATVSVHVIQGEQQAAVQELTSGTGSWRKAYWQLFYAIVVISSIIG